MTLHGDDIKGVDTGGTWGAGCLSRRNRVADTLETGQEIISGAISSGGGLTAAGIP